MSQATSSKSWKLELGGPPRISSNYTKQNNWSYFLIVHPENVFNSFAISQYPTEELFKILQLKNISLSTTSTTSSTSISSNSSNFPPNGSNNNATGLVRNKEAVILIFIFVLWIYSIGRWDFPNIQVEKTYQQNLLHWLETLHTFDQTKRQKDKKTKIMFSSSIFNSCFLFFF